MVERSHVAHPANYTELLAIVFSLSMASIAFEILLARVFSISQWNNLAFMVISLALLGFASGGISLCLLEIRPPAWYPRAPSAEVVRVLALLYALTAIGSLVFLQAIPLDYFRLPLEPIQGGYLLATFLVLALPFFWAGLGIALAYIQAPQKSGHIYFASMSGSAIGALLPLPLLPILGEAKLLMLVAIIPLAWFCRNRNKAPNPAAGASQIHCRRNWLQAFTLGVVIIVLGLLIADRSIFQVRPSPYKGLSQNLLLPKVHVNRTFYSLRGRYEVISSPYIRYAPGLSLQYSGALPFQTAFFKDGDNQTTLYSVTPSQSERFAEFMLAYAGYRLRPAPAKVLLILQNGGSSLPCALSAQASDLTVLAREPIAARLIERHYGLPVMHQNPRIFLARSERRFDVIHLENWGGSLPGASALSQDYNLTIEAFRLYLEHLSENGVFLVTRKLQLPPADSVRLWATAYESLRSSGHDAPERHIAILRNWDTFVLMVQAHPLTQQAAIADFARQLNFDVVYLPNGDAGQANRFNVFDRPYHHLAIESLRKAYRNGTAPLFFKEYLLDVAPQSDHRPFPDRLLKWSRIGQYYQATGRRLYTLLLSGEVVVPIVLIEAIGVSVLLLVLPLFFLPGTTNTLSVSALVFFLSIGFGFMLVELFFINVYTLFFMDPVVSLTVVLTGLLISSSVGGYVSQNIGFLHLKRATVALLFFLAGIGLTFDRWTSLCLVLPPFARYLAAATILLPVGFLMGLPFPVGMRLLLPVPAQRAHAWAANGCASVITAVAAAQIAISVGLPALMNGALFAYAAALLALKCKKPAPC